ncbi:hypothetical protein [Treponema sp.]|uniref:hypothetical protein n=1 Tax=Treponema sp. TaxID=166 RepID=UPI0025FBE0B6|nr:hypothetical protein [Treponema sp.]MCR5219076.1 hypothetical protein [Treponema sp.]
MKLEKLFDSENNTLIEKNGNKIDLSGCPVIDAVELCNEKYGNEKFSAVKIKWSYIGFDEESYNEEFLALLRDKLKDFEEDSKYVFIIPEADAECSSNDKMEAFAAGMNHCARRIKDCASVIGFAIPDNLNAADFMELLLKKHQHYVFFSNKEEVLADKKIVRY